MIVAEHMKGVNFVVTLQEKIRVAAIDILKSSPEGMRYSELVKCICEKVDGGVNEKTVKGTLYRLKNPESRSGILSENGLYRYVTVQNFESLLNTVERPSNLSLREFLNAPVYKAISDYLYTFKKEFHSLTPDQLSDLDITDFERLRFLSRLVQAIH
jgi:hypothetical protein